ncbi:MAG: nicotinate-nucleotide adenylyltransferase [Chitinophagaceae bacterium]|nr:nicotinate-nucleotide adenylyltransferase [Chitinophagaceae bacterium]
MKIGLFFGSFNPIHTGHLIIANHVLNETGLDKIWLVVSPQNPFKVSASLLNEYNRLHLARLATEDDNRIKASEIEFKLPRPSYTADTLAYLTEKYPRHEFAIIMGSDSYQNLHKWKNYEVIIKNFPLYIYKREGFEIKPLLKTHPVILNAPLLQISSTGIRELIKNGKSVRYMLPEKVRDEIEQNRYYKK